MNMSYDPIVDALMLRLSAAPVEESDEVAPGVILDYDEDGQVIGIEVLDVSKRAGAKTSIESVLQPRKVTGEGEYTRAMMAGSVSDDKHTDSIRRHPVPGYVGGKSAGVEIGEINEHAASAENPQELVPSGRA